MEKQPWTHHQFILDTAGGQTSLWGEFMCLFLTEVLIKALNWVTSCDKQLLSGSKCWFTVQTRGRAAGWRHQDESTVTMKSPSSQSEHRRLVVMVRRNVWGVSPDPCRCSGPLELVVPVVGWWVVRPDSPGLSSPRPAPRLSTKEWLRLQLDRRPPDTWWRRAGVRTERRRAE